MKKIFVAILMALTVLCGMSLAAQPVSALAGVDECEKDFMGFRPWYKGLTEKPGENCVIKTPVDDSTAAPAGGEIGLTTFVWAVVLNILTDLTLAVAYLAMAFIIYGGYLYIFSTGDPGKIASAKKVLISAVTGTVIALLGSLICNFIVMVLS